jgi:hypothetical protein
MSRTALAAGLLLALATGGCGLVRPAGPSEASGGRPDGVTASAPAGRTPSPVPSCPPPAGRQPAGCVTMPSWEEQHAGNRAYRQRVPMSPDVAAAADAVAGALRGRLAALRERARYGEPHVGRAVRAVAPQGTNVVIRPVGARSGVVFAIELAGGCVTGFHDERASEVEVGGYVSDGGCLTAPGH